MPPKNLSKTDENPPPLLINRNTISEGFTQSEFSDMSCFQRWNYRYNQLLVKPGVEKIYFVVGGAFHDAMEQFYHTKGVWAKVATLQFKEHDVPAMTDITKLDYWNHVLPAMVEAYTIYYRSDPIKWNIIHTEREVDIMYRGYRLRGKIDLTAFLNNKTQQKWIWDHKTTFTLDLTMVAGWDFRFQFMFYIWLMSICEPDLKLTGFVVNAVKKPALRLKQNESLPTFAARVKQDMIEEPAKYFYRSEYPITKDALDHFQREVVDPKIDKIDFIIRNPGHPLSASLMKEKNTDECQKWGGSPCPYIDLCRHGESMRALYTTKPAKHEELTDEIE